MLSGIWLQNEVDLRRKYPNIVTENLRQFWSKRQLALILYFVYVFNKVGIRFWKSSKAFLFGNDRLKICYVL